MGVQGRVKDRMEKFGVLPFSMGCASQASVAVAEQKPRRSKSDFKSPSSRKQEEEDDEESLKHSSRVLARPRPNLSTGVNRLVKGFKSLSQLFIYEDEMEELDMKMEIGCPTDVKHVTHIGCDGFAGTNPLIGWDNLINPDLLSHPPSAPSLKQFEFPTSTANTTATENDSPTFISFKPTSSLA